MNVRLLCCSDTHDAMPPVLDETGALAWLHGGDCRNGWRKEFDSERHILDERGKEWPTHKDAAISRWYREHTIPIFLVRGNHDTSDPYHAFENSDDITGRVLQITPHLFVAGIGWSGTVFADLPGESDLKPACESVRQQAWRRVMPKDSLVLLTHYPAEIPGLFSSRRRTKGYNCIRELIDELEPKVVIQGHHHEWFGTKSIYEGGGKSLIINPGPAGAQVDINLVDGSVPLARIIHARAFSCKAFMLARVRICLRR